MADTKLQLLRQAAKLVGNEELAKRLNVPLTLLEAWLRGLATMPDRKLLTLADLLDKLGDPEK
jgi:transcriptional regulator with XRE-family HTH domain